MLSLPHFTITWLERLLNVVFQVTSSMNLVFRPGSQGCHFVTSIDVSDLSGLGNSQGARYTVTDVKQVALKDIQITTPKSTENLWSCILGGLRVSHGCHYSINPDVGAQPMEEDTQSIGTASWLNLRLSLLQMLRDCEWEPSLRRHKFLTAPIKMSKVGW